MTITAETESVMRRSASLFNGTVVSSAITAAFELGLLDEISESKTVAIRGFSERHDLHYESVRAILLVLQSENIVKLELENDIVVPDILFHQIFSEKGYFQWLVGGYGAMLQDLSSMTKAKNRVGNFSKRCGKRIVTAGRDYGAHFVDGHFRELIEESDYTFVADVGCGSAERLIQLANSNPGLRGVGIEVNQGAARLAQTAISKADLQERVRVVSGDVIQLPPIEEAEDVEIIFSFFMGHDLWPRDTCLTALNNLRRIFPKASRFLLCDTYRSEAFGEPETPIFTLGFELTHAVMGDYVPTMEEWTDLFHDSEWTLEDCRPIDIPYSCIFDLRV